jgi:hypothetical protein
MSALFAQLTIQVVHPHMPVSGWRVAVIHSDSFAKGTRALFAEHRDADTELGDHNPDPTQCGIPVQWGKEDPALPTGVKYRSSSFSATRPSIITW